MAPAKARSAEAGQTQAEPAPVDETQAGPAPADSGNGGGEAQGAEREAGGRRTATLELPFVTARFRKPNVHLPSRREAEAAAGAAAAKVRSLSPAELAYYAGLGLLTAVELIEWPVALVVGAGTALARSGRDGGDRGATGVTGSAGAGGAGGDGGSGGERAEEGSGPGQ